MLTFKREAVVLVLLAFYFLVLDQQTQESRLQQLILLQHLKRSRPKRLILLQITLHKTRRVRRAWSWPGNQFFAHLYCARFSRHQRAHMGACTYKTYSLVRDFSQTKLDSEINSLFLLKHGDPRFFSRYLLRTV